MKVLFIVALLIAASLAYKQDVGEKPLGDTPIAETLTVDTPVLEKIKDEKTPTLKKKKTKEHEKTPTFEKTEEDEKTTPTIKKTDESEKTPTLEKPEEHEKTPILEEKEKETLLKTEHEKKGTLRTKTEHEKIETVETPTLEKTETKPKEEIKDEARIEDQRIASGTDAVAGENLDYVLLSVVFYNQAQTCGGILVHPQWVLTTASCVKDPVEGVASIVNATFPQKTTNNVLPKLQIIIHEMYDPTTYANNVALIKLQNATTVDNKTLAIANYTTETAPDLYVHKVLRLCGFGSIANYYTKPAKMKCTDLYVQPTANCSSVMNTICTIWTDRDNNACNNDYGGPLYLYNYNGTKFTQTVVGMASHSPDYRPNAPCYDGHKVVHVQTSNYLMWINNIINPPVAPPPPAAAP